MELAIDRLQRSSVDDADKKKEKKTIKSVTYNKIVAILMVLTMHPGQFCNACQIMLKEKVHVYCMKNPLACE